MASSIENARPETPGAPRSMNMNRRIRDTSNNQYKVLLDQLQTLGFGKGGALRTIGLTSSNRREGVTTVACNLALYAASSLGLRVLLVDANSSSPELHKIFQLPQAPGLVDLLNGHVTELECILDMSSRPSKYLPPALRNSFRRSRRDPFSGLKLSILPVGNNARGSWNFCGAQDEEFLEKISVDYDLIIVDLPAVNSATNCEFSVSSLDGVLFVLAAEATSDMTAQKSLHQLRQLDANLLGVAFNKCRSHLPKWISRKLGV